MYRKIRGHVANRGSSCGRKTSRRSVDRYCSTNFVTFRCIFYFRFCGLNRFAMLQTSRDSLHVLTEKSRNIWLFLFCYHELEVFQVCQIAPDTSLPSRVSGALGDLTVAYERDYIQCSEIRQHSVWSKNLYLSPAVQGINNKQKIIIIKKSPRRPILSICFFAPRGLVETS